MSANQAPARPPALSTWSLAPLCDQAGSVAWCVHSEINKYRPAALKMYNAASRIRRTTCGVNGGLVFLKLAWATLSL